MKLHAFGHYFNLRIPTTEALFPNPCSLGDLLRDAGFPGIVRELALDVLIATRTTGQRIASRKTQICRLEEFSFNDKPTGQLNRRSFIAKHDWAIAVIEDRIKAIA